MLSLNGMQAKIDQIKEGFGQLKTEIDTELARVQNEFAREIADAELVVIQRRQELEHEHQLAESNHQRDLGKLRAEEQMLRTAVEKLRGDVRRLREGVEALPV